MIVILYNVHVRLGLFLLIRIQVMIFVVSTPGAAKGSATGCHCRSASFKIRWCILYKPAFFLTTTGHPQSMGCWLFGICVPQVNLVLRQARVFQKTSDKQLFCGVITESAWPDTSDDLIEKILYLDIYIYIHICTYILSLETINCILREKSWWRYVEFIVRSIQKPYIIPQSCLIWFNWTLGPRGDKPKVSEILETLLGMFKDHRGGLVGRLEVRLFVKSLSPFSPWFVAFFWRTFSSLLLISLQRFSQCSWCFRSKQLWRIPIAFIMHLQLKNRQAHSRRVVECSRNEGKTSGGMPEGTFI